MPRPEIFNGNAFPQTKWGIDNKPIVIVDGNLHSNCNINRSVNGIFAYCVGLNEKDFEILSDKVNVRSLKIYEVKSKSLHYISKMKYLKDLEVNWSNKIKSIEFIGELSSIENLILTDLSKLESLDGIQHLKNLRYLEVNGGNTRIQKYKTLRHIGLSDSVEELTLTNVIDLNESLEFLIGMKSLKILNISSAWPTREYAVLSKCRPDIKCDMLWPWVKWPNRTSDLDVMIVGKGKPFLNSKRDAVKIKKYEEEFENLKNTSVY